MDHDGADLQQEVPLHLPSPQLPIRYSGELNLTQHFSSHRGQVCYIHMILQEFDQDTARLNPNIIKMESELELSTYTISEWDLVHFEDGKTKLNMQ